jgi:hypothetical protein
MWQRQVCSGKTKKQQQIPFGGDNKKSKSNGNGEDMSDRQT